MFILGVDLSDLTCLSEISDYWMQCRVSLLHFWECVICSSLDLDIGDQNLMFELLGGVLEYVARFCYTRCINRTRVQLYPGILTIVRLYLSDV